MNTIPTINEEGIRDFIGERSFLLGQQYFRGQAIFSARRQGMTLKARCQGSQADAYRVEATFDAAGIADASCSCPVGYRCKHIAALLLTWLHQPGEFLEQQEVDTVLEQCSKAELIALIKKMLRRQPDFEMFLPVITIGEQKETFNPDIYRRQVETALRRGGYGWGAVASITDELFSIKESADDYLEQQDYARAISIYEVIVKGVMENYEQYDDENGDLGSVLDECASELDECLAGVQEDTALREKILKVLFKIYSFDVQAGGIGIGEDVPDILVEHTTAEERRTIAGWIRDTLTKEGRGISEWEQEQYASFLVDLEADTLDDEAFLRVCREMGRIYDLIDRLLTLGRIDEAIKEAEQVDDYELVGMANLFVQHGHDSLAERIVQERSKQSQNSSLLEWLKQRYLARNDQVTALDLAGELFRLHPSLLNYQEVHRIAEQLGRWEALRPNLHAFLNKSQSLNIQLLVQVALADDDIDRALELVRSEPKPNYSYGYDYYIYSAIDLEVAKAAEQSRPRAAIEIYQKHVERLIDQRGRASYQTACSYLLKTRALYEKLGEDEEWKSYITALRERNHTLRALKEEMANAGL